MKKFHLAGLRGLKLSVGCGWLLAAGLQLLPPPAVAQPAANARQAAIIAAPERIYPVYSDAGMVVSQHYLASRVGRDILANGGNAVDAAIATGFALAVVLPRAGNLAGGGFMLLYLAEENRTLAFDYREMAPAAAHRDMYLNAEGEADMMLSRFSLKASGVPGTVAGLHHVWSKYGSMPWRKLLAPAIALAEKGMVVSRSMQAAMQRARHLKKDPAARAVFYRKDGAAPYAGSLLKQRDLGRTLRRIAKGGAREFYRGQTARYLVDAMEAGDGLITMEDMAAYRVVEREPLRGTYQGVEVVTMPPPSSGGVHLIQMLNVLQGYGLKSWGKGSAQSLHVIAEAMKLAYADRSEHLGDSDFYPVPVQWLTSAGYAEQQRGLIDLDRARPSDEIRAGTAPPKESTETTHFSIVDAAGNAVANTYTLNFSYGSGIMVPGAGMLLNNEMDDFVSKPGTANAFGLHGSEANAIEARKRPLSSMTPTLLFRDGRLLLVTGSPGGGRIITTVLQHVVDVVEFGLNVATSVAEPRLHHQWQPPMLFHEGGFSPDTLALLSAKGHRLRQVPPNCSLQSVAVAPDGTLMGASDPRRPDGSAAAVR